MQDWIQSGMDGLVAFMELQGYYLLLLTIPLTIVQGIITIFPFASVLILHVSTFGWVEGIAISWLSGMIASILCFYLTRSVIQSWIERRFAAQLARNRRWLLHMDHYGGWVVIFLRSIPFVPNNIVSILAAISQIRVGTYIWSSAIGMLSQVWLFGLLGSEVIFPEKDIGLLWRFYLIACGTLVLIFFVRLTFFLKKDDRKLNM